MAGSIANFVIWKEKIETAARMAICDGWLARTDCNDRATPSAVSLLLRFSKPMTTDSLPTRYTVIALNGDSVDGQIDEATRKRMRASRLMLAGKTPAEAAKAGRVARQTTTRGKPGST
nr:hypothetical protein [Burkholderia ubonensis]